MSSGAAGWLASEASGQRFESSRAREARAAASHVSALSLVCRADPPGIPLCRKESHMLVTLVIILLVLAVIGGVAVNPLLFLIALLALLVFFGGRRGSAV